MNGAPHSPRRATGGRLHRLRRVLSRAAVALTATAGLLVWLALMSPSAQAQSALDGQPAIRNKIQLFEGRHAIELAVGTTVNDAFSRNVLGGFHYRFYFANWVGLGIDAFVGGGVGTQLSGAIEDELTTDDRTFVVDASELRFLGSLMAEFIPFEGKLKTVGGGFARIAAHVSVGVGGGLFAGSGPLDDRWAIAPSGGLGLRIFPTDALSIGFEVRGHAVERVQAVRRDGSVPAAAWESMWFVGVRVGMMLPFEPSIAP